MNTPNLYDFATSELSQDATLAYMLSWAKPEYRVQHPKLNRLGESLLRALVGAAAKAKGIANPLPGAVIKKLEVATQKNRIDVQAKINDDVFLVIEDKTGTCEHSDQIAGYTQAASRMEKPDGKPWKVMPVYVKTGNECRLPAGAAHGVFLREDLLAVLDEVPNTGNTIVREFREHLRRWQQETDSFRSTPYEEWTQTWAAQEGYYMALEAWLDKQPGRRNSLNDPGWGYVPNPSGGFLGFWWHWRDCKALRCNLYLQIEDACCLKVRAGGAQNEAGEEIKITSDVLWPLFHAVEAAAAQERPRSIQVRKAGRFRGGAGSGVAEVLFADRQDTYMATDENGIIDMATTQQRLLLAMDLIEAACAKTDEARA
jgi:hypothetical protein